MKRASDYYPQPLIDFLLPLGRLRDPRWVEVDVLPSPRYKVRMREGLRLPPLFKKCIRDSSDLMALSAASHWLADGPKFAAPSLEECEAFCEVEVSIDPKQYRQPFPAVMVDLPEGFGRFRAVLLHLHTPEVLVMCLIGRGRLELDPSKTDIVTMIRLTDEVSIETSIHTYADDIDDDSSRDAARALRVAINTCLLMTHYGHSARWALAKERAADEATARKRRGDDVGRRAAERLDTHLQELSFSQSVPIFTVSGVGDKVPSGSHASPRPHWRKGHWRTRPVRKELGPVYIGPVLVRSDAFRGERSDTSVEYTER